MSEILLDYKAVHPTTWVYLSSLLMIGLFFKFGRFWSVRNLDLVLLILLAPGLLLVQTGRMRVEEELQVFESRLVQPKQSGPLARGNRGSALDAFPTGISVSNAAPELAANAIGEQPEGGVPPAAPAPGDQSGASLVPAGEQPEDLADGGEGFDSSEVQQGQFNERLGFIWLLSVGLLWLVRLLADPTMVRRPLLEPNLTTGGLTFIGCSLFVFLMANVVNSDPTADDLQGARGAEQLLSRRAADEDDQSLQKHGPGYALLNLLPTIPTVPFKLSELEAGRRTASYIVTAKIMAILAHLAVVVGVVAIGYRHFDNIKMGIGAATLYLMLPYTAQMTGRVPHVLPAALLVWAVLCYRRPLLAGTFIGLAIGVIYYPLFLLPLWMSFYWQRGLSRFVVGVISASAVMLLSLIFISSDVSSFLAQAGKMFGVMIPRLEGLSGIWGLGWPPVYRLPVLATFVALSGTFALWPAQKNLGTLLSCSAALMVATQFWHGYDGGLYMAWYLPLSLLTVFRPNLEDRVALTVLGEGWFPRRRANVASIEKAA